MKVQALGDHAVGMDIMRAVMKALPEAIKKLGPTEEGKVASQMYSAGGKLFHSTQAGHADATDPMRQVAQAIMARRAQAGGAGPPPGAGAPPGPVGPAMPHPGPVPMPAGAGAPA